MTPPLRLLLCLVYVYSAFSSVAYLCPGLLGSVRSELICLVRAQHRQQELQVELDQALARNEGRRDVVLEVVAGRLKLGEAAVRFRELDEACFGSEWVEAQRRLTGRSD